MKTIVFYICMTFIFLVSCDAAESKDKQELKKDPRILELIPNLLCPLAVEPGIPADFVALSPKGILDPNDWIYWGPKSVLKAYFENPTSLKEPIIRVKLNAGVAQTGPKSFDKSFIDLLKKIGEEKQEGFAYIETQWGDYPVIAFRKIMSERLRFGASVGLNDPETGWTLVFDLVYPLKEGHPNLKHRQLWESLILKTSQLKDGDYFKAYGQDLQNGYTNVNIGGAKLKMLAEKRQGDGTVQVVVIPESSDIEFHYVDMEETAMGADWKHGEPMVKVYGKIVVKNENFESSTSYVTSIFFTTVPDFSLKRNDEGSSLIFQKKQQEAG